MVFAHSIILVRRKPGSECGGRSQAAGLGCHGAWGTYCYQNWRQLPKLCTSRCTLSFRAEAGGRTQRSHPAASNTERNPLTRVLILGYSREASLHKGYFQVHGKMAGWGGAELRSLPKGWTYHIQTQPLGSLSGHYLLVPQASPEC